MLQQINNNQTITVEIANQAGSSSQIKVHQNDTLYALKCIYQQICQIDPSMQKLSFNGSELKQNTTTLKQLNIKNLDKIMCLNDQIFNTQSTKENEFYIKIRDLCGKEYEIECEVSNLVEEIMIKIKNKQGIPEDQQRLIFAGKQLEEGRSLSDYGVYSGALFHLVLKLRGC